ncbi:cation:dicarboxylate symporter family transporter [Cupriavidus basilensis]
MVGLVVPTGYSFNLDGTNIYMTMAVLFIAQARHRAHAAAAADRPGVAMITSKGASGMTGAAGFITLAATLAVVPDIPVAGTVLDPGHRPLHERMPRADQYHWQRRGDGGHVGVGA